jgi:hypothetical protein
VRGHGGKKEEAEGARGRNDPNNVCTYELKKEKSVYNKHILQKKDSLRNRINRTCVCVYIYTEICLCVYFRNCLMLYIDDR